MARGGLTFEDGNSLITNPAGISRLERLTLIGGAERPFLLPELQSISLALAVPLKAGSFGLTLQRKGFSLFSRQQIGLAYAREISPEITIGIRLWLRRTVIRDYGNHHAPGADLGFQVKILKELALGGRLATPAGLLPSAQKTQSPLLAIGLGYRPSEKVLIILETEKELDTPARIVAALEFQPAPETSLRVGVNTSPASYTFGAGVKMGKHLTFDVGAGYHPILGFSPCVTIQYSAEPR